MKLAILKYNAGNIRSVTFAMKRLGADAIVSDKEAELLSADKVIIPGVGEAHSAMEFLKVKGLDQLILSLRQPVLGICLGMQLMCAHSEEGDTDCLGIFPQAVKRFTAGKVPQVGWNSIAQLRSPLFSGIKEEEYMYFVHGYYAETGSHTISETTYGRPYSSAMQKDNFFAVQFHPEKSGKAGEQLLRNFLAL